MAYPRPEEYTSAMQYHMAVLGWRKRHGMTGGGAIAKPSKAARLRRRIEEKRRQLAAPGCVPVPIILDAIASLEREMEGLA